MGTLRVRPAVPDDVAAVRRIARAAWTAAYGDLFGERIEQVRYRGPPE